MIYDIVFRLSIGYNFIYIFCVTFPSSWQSIIWKKSSGDLSVKYSTDNYFNDFLCFNYDNISVCRNFSFNEIDTNIILESGSPNNKRQHRKLPNLYVTFEKDACWMITMKHMPYLSNKSTFFFTFIYKEEIPQEST